MTLMAEFLHELHEEWREAALCKGLNPALFFPEPGISPRYAKRICALCPVRQECLAYALEHHQRTGVFGGTTEKERRVLLRRQVRGVVVVAPTQERLLSTRARPRRRSGCGCADCRRVIAARHNVAVAS